jgi:epoxyqueuosine reductase QueG
MAKFDHSFLEEMKSMLNVELIGVASVTKSGSKDLKKYTNALLPGTKSVVVLGKEIFQEMVALLGTTKEVGEAFAGDYFLTHTEYINGRLTNAVHGMAGLLRDKGYRSLPMPTVAPTDQRFLKAVFSYKDAAELAGLGTVGRHTMLITPEFGPRIKLTCLLTEAVIEPTPKSRKNYCINCNACIEACPSKALQKPKKGQAYSMNPYACRTYRVAGLNCSVCMKVCDETLSKQRA